MARIYYKNADGDYIRDDEDAYMTGEPEDCCCGCDCETNGPTASMTYEKTGEPCEFTFTDTSTAGECGAIVSRSWKVNGVEQGTGTTFEYDLEEEDSVTLTVTDEAGCEATTGASIVCDDCCEEPGGPPTALISYEQTIVTPCTIRLSDDSTPGSCGSIASRQWYKNGVPFSTSSSPTVAVADGDIIELEVTDSSGCVDTLAVQVVCAPSLCCAGETMPLFVTVTLPVLPDTTGCKCSLLSGQTFVLPRISACTYRLIIESCPDEDPGHVLELFAYVFPDEVGFSATLNPTTGRVMGWRLLRSATTCRGTWNVPFRNNPAFVEPCGATAWTTGEVGKDVIMVV